MPDGTMDTTAEQPGSSTPPPSEPAKDAAFWQAEAKRAFEARDRAKRQLAQLEAAGVTPEAIEEYRTLKEQATKAEEERRKKAGEYDALKQQLTERHLKELADREARERVLADRFKQTVIQAEFGKASDYFGGDSAKTILDVDLGIAALGKYVQVEDTDDGGYRVVVKNPAGATIVGPDGNPAPFAVAIGELISQLPNKDRILRGSGKTGSGSSGGTHSRTEPADVDTLIQRARTGDKAALAALESRQRAKGAMQIGPAFHR